MNGNIVVTMHAVGPLSKRMLFCRVMRVTQPAAAVINTMTKANVSRISLFPLKGDNPSLREKPWRNVTCRPVSPASSATFFTQAPVSLGMGWILLYQLAMNRKPHRQVPRSI